MHHFSLSHDKTEESELIENAFSGAGTKIKLFVDLDQEGGGKFFIEMKID